MFRYINILLILFSFLIVLHPQSLLAENITPTTDITKPTSNTFTCIDTKNVGGVDIYDPASEKFIELVINCVKIPITNAVLNETSGILAKLQKWIFPILPVIFTLALISHGIKAINMESQLLAMGFMLIFRIGIILFLLIEINTYAKYVFDSFDALLQKVTASNFSPWVQIDSFMKRLIGYSNGIDLKNGIIGLLISAFFSENFGILLSLVGAFAVFSLLLFILQAVYIYLASFLAIAFLLTISPLLIPLLVFDYTKPLFIKWIDLIVAGILTPMLLFVFLLMFIGTSTTPISDRIFENLINEIFTELGPDYLERCMRSDQPLTNAFLMPTDSASYVKAACITSSDKDACREYEKNTSSMQSFNNPYVFRSINYSLLNVPVFDCGDDDKRIKRAIIEKLTELLLFTLILNSVLGQLPPIAAGIARGAAVGVTDMATPLIKIINKIKG